jgi:DNA-binding transcriptional LysR family regulator
MRADRSADLLTARVGSERRYAALAADHPLADRSSLRLADFADESVALDVETGTTRDDLWGPETRPAAFRMVRGVDEWLTLIASGGAVGASSEATASQHPRPGIAYRPIDDAPPIAVWLVWWKDNPPDAVRTLVELSRTAYGSEA